MKTKSAYTKDEVMRILNYVLISIGEARNLKMRLIAYHFVLGGDDRPQSEVAKEIGVSKQYFSKQVRDAKETIDCFLL